VLPSPDSATSNALLQAVVGSAMRVNICLRPPCRGNGVEQWDEVRLSDIGARYRVDDGCKGDTGEGCVSAILLATRAAGPTASRSSHRFQI
jgi:hypothetical protein